MSKKQPRSDITLTRLVATALAAITAAFLGSRLGMAGTVIGAGVASMVSTVAGALYQHSLDRTSNRVRSRVAQARGDEPAEPEPAETTLPMDRPPVDPPRRLRWRTAAALTAVAFVIGMGAVTGYELLNHGPISGGDNGTTISGLFGQPTEHRPPAAPTTVPTPTSTSQPPTTTSVPPTTTPSSTTTTSPTTTTSTPPTDSGTPTSVSR